MFLRKLILTLLAVVLGITVYSGYYALHHSRVASTPFIQRMAASAPKKKLTHAGAEQSDATELASMLSVS